jgi:hypothetical protein
VISAPRHPHLPAFCWEGRANARLVTPTASWLATSLGFYGEPPCAVDPAGEVSAAGHDWWGPLGSLAAAITLVRRA